MDRSNAGPTKKTAYEFHTVDVFTDQQFGGNPLAVFPDAQGLSDAAMQSLAREFNLSETTFVLPPAHTGHTARVRIFNRYHEMPFAGHPMVGTAYVLANAGRLCEDALIFEVPAGLVHVELHREDFAVTGATIQAPEVLSIGITVEVEHVARCIGLRPSQILSSTHLPVEVSVGNSYVVAEVEESSLDKAVPDIGMFQQVANMHPGWRNRFSLYLYAHAQGSLRARMFAPLAGTYEDPATGSAATPLGALLLSLGSSEREDFVISQGEKMKRASLLFVTAFRVLNGIRARVRGSCVEMFTGKVTLSRTTANFASRNQLHR